MEFQQESMNSEFNKMVKIFLGTIDSVFIKIEIDKKDLTENNVLAIKHYLIKRYENKKATDVLLSGFETIEEFYSMVGEQVKDRAVNGTGELRIK